MHARRSSRTFSSFHLSTIAVLSAFVVLTVTALVAATGDNIADAVLGQIDLSHNGINNPGAASLNSPSQMAVDLNSTPEHLYVVDGGNNRILGWHDAAGFANGQAADIEIGQPDFETTLCNSGTANGDVAGLGADSICQPSSVAVDAAGNLYVADSGNNRVLEYNNPFAQMISLGFAANVVFGQGGSFTQSVCAQTASGLCFPQGVASDSNNNLYVADAGNHRVLEFNQPLAPFNAMTGAGDTVADLVFGQGAAGTNFSGHACDLNGGPASAVGMCNPLSVVVDASGDLYVGDDGDHRVLEFNQPLAPFNAMTGDGDVTADRVFGQGSNKTNFTESSCYDGVGLDPAPSADGLCDITGIAVDAAGDLFVTDVSNSRVLEYLNPLASGGGSPGTPGSAGDVTADVVFGQGNSFTTSACGIAGSGAELSGSVLCLPDGVALDGASGVFVADALNNRVLKYTSPVSSPPVAGAVLGQADLLHGGINNPTAAALQAPDAVAIDSSGGNNRLYVADSANNRVLGWASAASFENGAPADVVIGQPDAHAIAGNDGVAMGDSGGVGPDSLCDPVDVAVDTAGHLYVADSANNRVLEYDNPFGAGSPFGLSANRVFGQNGSFTTVGCDLGTATINASTMCTPTGLAVDTAGDLFVSDRNNNRVLEFNQPLAVPNMITGAGDAVADTVFGQNGIFSTGLCNQGGASPSAITICTPRGLVTDSNGDLFVADTGNARVLEFNQPLGPLNAMTGAGDTIADQVFGQGASGTSFTTGACSAASATELCAPGGVGLDISGDLFVADVSNNRVVEYNQPLAAPDMMTGAGNVTADRVFGQGAAGTDFTTSVCGDSLPGDPAPSATSMCQPAGVAIDASGNLYVSDTSNNRLMRFDNPLGPYNGPTPTATATSTSATATATPTATATAATATATDTATATPTATSSATNTPTGTDSATATATQTATATSTATATDTSTATATATQTATSTATATATDSPTPTSTATSTATLTPTATITATQTATSTATATGTSTATATATVTSTSTATTSATQTATSTATATATPTATTATATSTPTATSTTTASAIQTATSTATASSTATAKSTVTATASATSTATATATPTETATATETQTATATNTATATSTRTATATSTATATRTPTATPTVTPVPVALVIAPHQINFGKVVFGSNAVSKVHKVTIKNDSKTTTVTFTSIGVSGDFRMQNGCGVMIASHGKCVVTLTFSPTAMGARDGALTIDSNARNSASSVGLSGTGVAPKK